jgi:hypothetical protein
MKGDLHIHSVYSDGSFTPLEIAKEAKRIGVEVFSITDHDGTGDIKEKIDSAKQMNIHYIKGIELSSYNGEEQVHILGYGYDENNSEFKNIMESLYHKRLERTEIMLKRLKKYYNIDISFSEVENTSTESVGSMHIARAMIKKGYVKTVKEAFSGYIGQGNRAYCSEMRQTPFEAINTILLCGGVPVLAHPAKLNAIGNEQTELINMLIKAGLKGIEAYYSSHTKNQTEYYISLAKINKLIITCGSDFHGRGREERIGTPKYDFDDEILQTLKMC